MNNDIPELLKKEYSKPTTSLPKTYLFQKFVSSAIDLYRPVSKFSSSFSAHLINVLGEFAATGIHLTESPAASLPDPELLQKQDPDPS